METKMESKKKNLNPRASRSSKVGSVETDPMLVQELNELLANEYLIFTRTLNFHWNITGPRFHSLHVFLEGQYRDLLTMMDDVAERVRYFGDRPLSTLKEMKAEGSLREEPGHYPSPTEMLAELCEGHRAINEQIQQILSKSSEHLEEDQVTQDFLVETQGKHQKMIWMLRSHLETETPTESRKIN